METKLIRCIEVGRSQSGQPIIHILAANADGIEIYADDKDFVKLPMVFYECDREKPGCSEKCDGLCTHTADLSHASNFEYDKTNEAFWENRNNGKWIQLEGGSYKCSRCGYQAKKTVMGRPYYHYCPMCGQRKPETYKDFIVEDEK